MTCSICHKINHNADSCSSPIINAKLKNLCDIFTKGVRSYADDILYNHNNSFHLMNTPNQLYARLKSLTKTLSKSLWHKLCKDSLLTISDNMPFFSSFKATLHDKHLSVLLTLHTNNKFVRRAYYKHFFLRLLKLLCRFYYNMEPHNYRSESTFRERSLVFQSHDRSLVVHPPDRSLIIHPSDRSLVIRPPERSLAFQSHERSLALRRSRLIHNPPPDIPRLYHDFPFTFPFPYSPDVNYRHLPRVYHHESLMSTSTLVPYIPDFEQDGLNNAINNSIRTLELEDTAREEFARTELKSRISFHMDPPDQVYKNSSCSICLDPILPSTSVSLDCLHSYCTPCLDGVINQSKGNCPMCRTPIHTIHFKATISPASFNLLISAIQPT